MTGVTINKEPKVAEPKETLSEIATREIEKAGKKMSRAERKATKRVKIMKAKVEPEVARPEATEVVKPKTSREEMLRKAKALGLFRYNKSERQYEIIVPIHDFMKL